MNIKLHKPLALAMGMDFVQTYGVDEDAYRFRHSEKVVQIDVSKFSKFKILQLLNKVREFPAHKGAQAIIKDITVWLDALKDIDGTKLTGTHQFYALVKKWFLDRPSKWVYFRDNESNVWTAYYVGAVSYTPPRRERDWTSPATTTLYLYYREFGSSERATIHFHNDDVAGLTVFKSMVNMGYLPETPDLRAQYDDAYARYVFAAENVGVQMLGRGEATDDLDGNPKRNDSWYWRRTRTYKLDKNGEPVRVVTDIFQEDDEGSANSRENVPDGLWWEKVKKEEPDEEGDITTDDDATEDAAVADGAAERKPPEIPNHMTLAVFNMRNHLRMRVHVDQLVPYPYQADLGTRLVLPQEDRDLVDILLAHNSTFADVVAGKGGGSVVLCTGKPGLGKTLTAEIYAEVAQRPLYTIQASQLGVSPEELEDNLLKTFARAERWRAILLIDEADVYIHPRGDDLIQNSIVGVFLRTLEYYRGVMFMTTNRPDLVDDAIASRCIARIHYEVPNADRQAAIWTILAAQNGATLAPKSLTQIVKENPNLSGRDVKNLVKLALLVAEAKHKNATITPDLVKFVRRFKPTVDLETK